MQHEVYCRVVHACTIISYRFVRIRDSGSLTMNSGDINLRISVRIVPGTPPRLSASGCSFSIGRLSVRFRGGARCVCVYVHVRTQSV